MTALLRRPRAVGGPIMANGTDPTRIFAELKNDINAFKTKHDGTLTEVQAEIDRINGRMASLGASAGVSIERPADPEYTQQFASFVRSGDSEGELRAANRTGLRQQINASMSVGTSNAGGYLAPTEWDRRILEKQQVVSPMRRLADVVQTGVNAYSTLWKTGGTGSGWVGETAARPETTSPTMEPIIFGHGEIYAMPAVTQTMLDDAQINLDGWLSDQLAQEFTLQEGTSFIAGNGTNKPRGFLTYVTGGASAGVHPGGNLTVVTVAGTTAVTVDELIDFFYGLDAPYRANAVWLMASGSIAKLSKLKDADGNFLWRPSFAAGEPATLLGRPVEVCDDMPAMVTGALPIALGDFKAGYVINDRMGVRILRDPYTAKPYVLFYSTKRVGGGLKDPRAIRVMKMA